jgi:hypothetical protein
VSLDDATIAALLDQVDVARLGACQVCLFTAAWPMLNEEPPRRVAGAVTQAANMTFDELQPALRVELERLRSRGVEGAAGALADLDARGWRSRVVRRIVERLAADMAIEMAANPLPREGPLWPENPLVPGG